MSIRKSISRNELGNKVVWGVASLTGLSLSGSLRILDQPELGDNVICKPRLAAAAKWVRNDADRHGRSISKSIFNRVSGDARQSDQFHLA